MRPYRIVVDAVAAVDAGGGRRRDVAYDACDDDDENDEVKRWTRTVWLVDFVALDYFRLIRFWTSREPAGMRNGADLKVAVGVVG